MHNHVLDKAQAYQVLQLEQGSSFNEIKYAYRKLALELHPDKNNAERDGLRFKQITEAYHLLKNSTKVANSKAREGKYTNTKTKRDETFSRTNWGARPGDSPPQEDWERYTRQTEQNDPFFWKSYVAEFWREYESRVNRKDDSYDFEIIEETKKEPDVIVDVDHSKCIGCCSCEIIAPQVFWVDKHSKMNPKSHVVNQKGAKQDKIMDAAQTCPTKAINVDEEDTGKRLYPY